MHRILNRKLTGLLFSLVAGLVFSLGAGAAGWSPGQVLKNVYPTSTGGALFSFETMSDSEGCATSNWYFLSATLAGNKNIMATALTAAATGKVITFYISGCDGNYPRITNAIMDI